MAAQRQFFSLLYRCRLSNCNFRTFSSYNGSVVKQVTGSRNRWGWSAAVILGGTSFFVYNKWKRTTVWPKLFASDDNEKRDTPKLTSRERRYQEFSSVVYKGDRYMTPGDFVESLLTDEPPYSAIQYLDDRTVQKVVKKTPSPSKVGSHFLRSIWDDGVLTYADYVFLVTALQKPRRQFEIVFRMIDVDGSDSIDMKEFEQMQKTVSRGKVSETNSKLVQSTLTAFLFGFGGYKKLKSHDLFEFIDNLQNEIREVEFNKHSLDGSTITPEQFAKILLSHTNYDKDEVVARLAREPSIIIKGINFQQFSDFCDLLNSLDDFSVAMTMYTIAGKALSEDEFSRAAQVSLGKSLDKDVIKTVFRIFDKDGDGKLSQKEFLNVMKNWKVRGMKMKQKKKEGAWPEFKTCIKMEMRNS